MCTTLATEIEATEIDWADTVWVCPECHSQQVFGQLWVQLNTSEIGEDTGRYYWCDQCGQDQKSLDVLPRAQTLEARQMALVALPS